MDTQARSNKTQIKTEQKAGHNSTAVTQYINTKPDQLAVYVATLLELFFILITHFTGIWSPFWPYISSIQLKCKLAVKWITTPQKTKPMQSLASRWAKTLEAHYFTIFQILKQYVLKEGVSGVDWVCMECRWGVDGCLGITTRVISPLPRRPFKAVFWTPSRQVWIRRFPSLSTAPVILPGTENFSIASVRTEYCTRPERMQREEFLFY